MTEHFDFSRNGQGIAEAGRNHRLPAQTTGAGIVVARAPGHDGDVNSQRQMW